MARAGYALYLCDAPFMGVGGFLAEQVSHVQHALGDFA